MLSMLRSLFDIAVEHGAQRTNPAAKLKRIRVKIKELSTTVPTLADFRTWVKTIARLEADSPMIAPILWNF